MMVTFDEGSDRNAARAQGSAARHAARDARGQDPSYGKYKEIPAG
jgi:hypothetical protein